MANIFREYKERFNRCTIEPLIDESDATSFVFKIYEYEEDIDPVTVSISFLPHDKIALGGYFGDILWTDPYPDKGEMWPNSFTDMGDWVGNICGSSWGSALEFKLEGGVIRTLRDVQKRYISMLHHQRKKRHLTYEELWAIEDKISESLDTILTKYPDSFSEFKSVYLEVFSDLGDEVLKYFDITSKYISVDFLGVKTPIMVAYALLIRLSESFNIKKGNVIEKRG